MASKIVQRLIEIKVTPKTVIDLPQISLSVRDINALMPLTKTHSPLTPHQEELLRTVACLLLNPLRPWEYGHI